MNQFKLIKTQDKFILVSDEEIKKGDYYIAWETNYATEPKERWVVYNLVSRLNGTNYKIIAGIPELPSIDFSLLSEEDCKTIGWVDVEKLAILHCEEQDRLGETHDYISFIQGFKTAQSFNDKMFSLEDIDKAIEYGHLSGMPFNEDWYNEFIQSLQQTNWEVEFEMETELDAYYRNGIGGISQPKITNNSIKIVKIL